MSYQTERAEWDRNYWTQLSQKCGGSVSEMARAAGCHRETVYRCLRRTGLIARQRVRGRFGAGGYRPAMEAEQK